MVESGHTALLWKAVLEEIRGQINRQQFETWFRKISPLSVNDRAIEIGVPSPFFKEWLTSYYLDVIHGAVRDAAGTDLAVDFVILEESEPTPEPTPAPPRPEVRQPTQIWAEHGPDGDGGGLRVSPRYPNFLSDILLNDHYTFENFIVGPPNKLPHAAAVAVADQPATAYNPLFLHGSVGLGKTHLLQAVCHALVSRRKDLRVLYLSCETFTNQFIAAVKSGNAKGFRYRFRHVDLLLIDDIHFLARKEQTQEEFFHTFNTLYNQQKQIILSSDSPPKEIPTLEERLVSRFRWGLVAEIEPPDFETRMLIVKRKATIRGHELADDVAEYIADNFTSNIRELEGAILKVLSVAELYGERMDLKGAHDALKSLITPTKTKISVDKIIQVTTEYFGVRQADLQSKKRTKSIAFPRQISMFLARNMTNHSLEEIGGYFGGRDHTTVLYAMDKIGKLKTKDSRLRDELDFLEQEILKA
jgi:chromosomal replication initiator protein